MNHGIHPDEDRLAHYMKNTEETTSDLDRVEHHMESKVDTIPMVHLFAATPVVAGNTEGKNLFFYKWCEQQKM